MTSYQVIEWGEPLERREYPTPDPRGTEVLVEVESCGVCHSDLHIHTGYFDMGGGRKRVLADLGVKLPLTLGHEPVGRVAAVGPEVDDPAAAGVPIGAPRVVWPWVGCRRCAACLREEDILCERGRYLGARVDGGYSDYLLVPHPRYLQPYDGIDADVAATYACAGITGYAAVKRALTTYPESAGTLGRIGPGDTLLLVGAGGVGLSALRVARAMTDARIVVADISAEKRALAEANGADASIDTSDPDAGRRLKEHSGAGVAASVDFVGMQETSQVALDSLRRGGTHVVVGLFGGELKVSVADYIYGLLAIRGSHLGTPQDLAELIELRRESRIEPPPIARRPLAEINDVFAALHAGSIDGRVVVVP
ncbi:MAG: alcohol dehydrogenase [Spirochaetaceae bacterium]|nr:alcohol dehydrogenase [Spirochaetaceae bacterium]